jgi:putative ABC transport system permease protein
MLFHFLRAALANLRLGKQTTLINVAGLSLGLTCFIVAYVCAAYLASADRHFPNADRIYVMQQRIVASGEDAARPFGPVSERLAPYLRVEAPELEAVARRTSEMLGVTADGRGFGLNVGFADPELLRIFAFEFVAGDASSALNEPAGAIVTEQTAETLFGSRDALGRVFSIGRQVGRTVDVVVRGIVRESDELTTARFPAARAGILVNIAARDALPVPGVDRADDRAVADDWSVRDFGDSTYVLLPRDGALTARELDRRLSALSERIFPRDGATISFRARHVSSFFEDSIDAALGLLGIASGMGAAQLLFVPGLLILAMACFNYVNLAVAVASTRAKEVGISKVLGAEARQVIQQHLVETTACVLAALGVALLLAPLLVGLINAATGFALPFVRLLGLRFWLGTALVVLLTSLVAGAYPAWVMSRFRPLESLRIGSNRSGSGALRSVFIGIQFAIASVLLTAVLVMYSQNAAMRGEVERLPADPYVQIENNLLETPDVDPELVTAALLDAPQIKGVTGMAEGFFTATLASDRFARSSSSADSAVNLRSRFISYDFFSTLGIDLLAGRSFVRDRDAPRGAGEGQTGTIGVVLDREAAAALGWPDPHDAVGQTVYRSTGSRVATFAATPTETLEIIGIVDKPPLQAMTAGLSNVYVLDPGNSRLILRLAPDDVPGALAHIEAVWQRLVPDMPLRRIRFLDETLERALFQMNVLTTALLSIVTFGFLVALAGIFGMALFVANRRRHEIGIRKSLGANAKDILRQLLVEFGQPVLIGNLVAWPLAYALSRFYSDLWLEQAPLTAWPYLLSLILTLSLAWLGFGGQALGAARLHPARVLRYE